MRFAHIVRNESKRAKRALIARSEACARLHMKANIRIKTNWRLHVLRAKVLCDAALAHERVELCKEVVSAQVFYIGDHGVQEGDDGESEE